MNNLTNDIDDKYDFGDLLFIWLVMVPLGLGGVCTIGLLFLAVVKSVIN